MKAWNVLYKIHYRHGEYIPSFHDKGTIQLLEWYLLQAVHVWFRKCIWNHHSSITEQEIPPRSCLSMKGRWWQLRRELSVRVSLHHLLNLNARDDGLKMKNFSFSMESWSTEKDVGRRFEHFFQQGKAWMIETLSKLWCTYTFENYLTLTLETTLNQIANSD